MTNPVGTTPPQMTFTRPKVGVVATPPKTNAGLSPQSVEIAKAKAPKELKSAGIKKKKSPINIVNYLWLGVASISSAVGISEIVKLLKKHH